MHKLDTFERASFDAYNPLQVIREPNNVYNTNGYGAYGTYVWNRVPTATSQVLGSLRGFSDWPAWTQALIVGGLAATVGYWGVKHVGPRLGLSGTRHRRRR